jgi:hypothetical protein
MRGEPNEVTPVPSTSPEWAGLESEQLAVIEDRLELLADDALTPEEEAELLRKLDTVPGGWRLCAMALLEVRALQKALRGWASANHPHSVGLTPANNLFPLTDPHPQAAEPLGSDLSEACSSFQAEEPSNSATWDVDLQCSFEGIGGVSQAQLDATSGWERPLVISEANTSETEKPSFSGKGIAVPQPEDQHDQPLGRVSVDRVSECGGKILLQRRPRSRWIGKIVMACGLAASFFFGLWVGADFSEMASKSPQLAGVQAPEGPANVSESTPSAPVMGQGGQSSAVPLWGWVPLMVPSDAGSYPVAIPVVSVDCENSLYQPGEGSVDWPSPAVSSASWLPRERIFREGHGLRYHRELVEWLTLDGLRLVVPVEEVSIMPQDLASYQ